MVNNLLYYKVKHAEKKEVNQNSGHLMDPLRGKPSRMNVSCDRGNGDPDTESIDINSRNIGTSRAADQPETFFLKSGKLEDSAKKTHAKSRDQKINACTGRCNDNS